MGFYGDFFKAENKRNKMVENEKRIEIENQQNFQREITNKKVDALIKLSDSLNNLSNSMSLIQQPIVLCISIDKDTNPENLKKLIEGLR